VLPAPRAKDPVPERIWIRCWPSTGLTAQRCLVQVRRMGKHSLRDGTSSFDVTVLKPEQPSRVVLFAVGSGGNPERHAPLLAALVARGCMVVAPHFERLLSSSPTEEDLVLRARRLRLALDSVALPEVPIVGVGHSIGATMLLALAGGRVWMRAGQPVAIAPDERLERLVLMAPVTGFFPGARRAGRGAHAAPRVGWRARHDHASRASRVPTACARRAGPRGPSDRRRGWSLLVHEPAAAADD
jgi:hypothetical protein